MKISRLSVLRSYACIRHNFGNDWAFRVRLPLNVRPFSGHGHRTQDVSRSALKGTAGFNAWLSSLVGIGATTVAANVKWNNSKGHRLTPLSETVSVTNGDLTRRVFEESKYCSGATNVHIDASNINVDFSFDLFIRFSMLHWFNERTKSKLRRHAETDIWCCLGKSNVWGVNM